MAMPTPDEITAGPSFLMAIARSFEGEVMDIYRNDPGNFDRMDAVATVAARALLAWCRKRGIDEFKED